MDQSWLQVDSVKHVSKRVFSCLTLFALIGCGQLPDVKPYAAATLQLERSIKQGFDESAEAQKLIAELLDVPESSEAFDSTQPLKQQYEDAAQKIENEAPARVLLLQALSDYADSLAAIVDAAEQAQANVDALAGSVQKLANTFGANPLTAGSQGALDLVKLAGREAIKMKASHDLRKGLELAEPVIQMAQKLLLDDASSLRRTVATKEEAIISAVELAERDRLKYRRRLEKRRADLISELADLDEGGNIEAASQSVELQTVEAQIAASEAWHRPLIARRDAAIAQAGATNELYDALQKAIQEWGTAHSEFVTAVREKRGFNVRRLTEVVFEIKEIVDRMKETEAASASK